MEELASHSERKQQNRKFKIKTSPDVYQRTRPWDIFQQVQRSKPHTLQRLKSNVALETTVWPVGTCQIQYPASLTRAPQRH